MTVYVRRYNILAAVTVAWHIHAVRMIEDRRCSNAPIICHMPYDAMRNILYYIIIIIYPVVCCEMVIILHDTAALVP